MSKRFRSVLRIGVSKTGITLLRTGGWLRARSEVLAEAELSEEESSSPEGIAAKLRSLLKFAQCSRLHARVVLADGWVRTWMVTPPRNATRLSDCAAAAAARFQVLYGDGLTDWQLAADWNCRGPFLACAMPQSLLTVLQQVAREYRLVLLEVAPQFVVAWNRWRAHLGEDAWFGVMHENALTVASLNRHGLGAVREVSLPAAPMLDQDEVPQIVAREALRLNVAMPAEIRLCGQIPEHWVMRKLDALNFVRLDHLRLDKALPPSAGVSLAVTGMRS